MIPEKIYEGIDIWDKKTGEIEKTIVFSEQINALSRNNGCMDFRLGFVNERKLYLIAWGMDRNIYINLDSETAEIWNFPEQYRRDEMPMSEYSLRHSAILLENESVIVCNLRGEWIVCDGSECHIIEKQSVWDSKLMKRFAKKEAVFNTRKESMNLYCFLEIENREQSINNEGNSGKVIYKCISG